MKSSMSGPSIISHCAPPAAPRVSSQCATRQRARQLHRELPPVATGLWKRRAAPAAGGGCQARRGRRPGRPHGDARRQDWAGARARGGAAHHQHELVAVRKNIQQPRDILVLQAAGAFDLRARTGPRQRLAHRRRPHLVLGPLGGRPERAGQPGGDPKPPSLGWWQLTVCAGARWRCPKARTPQHGRAARSFCSGLGQRPTSRCARWATLCDSAATSAPPCARSTCTRAPQRLRLPPRARQAQGLPSHHCRQHRRCMRAAA